MAPRAGGWSGLSDPAFWQGRRVWLTGHTGFKGAWLALWLQSMGASVHGFSAPGVVSEPSLYELAGVAGGMDGDVRGDVRSAGELRAAIARARPDVVLHLAAQSLVRRGLAKPARTFGVNVTGTAKVLDAVLGCDAAPRAVVVVTSDKCYRNDGSGRAFVEDDPLGGSDPYSASKAAQEHVAAAYRGLGLPVVTARAGNVIGGGDWAPDRLLADCMRAALGRSAVAVRAPASVRPWQHVLCPLDGYLMLAERLVAGEADAAAWNFGPAEDDARPVSWVVERVAAGWPDGLSVTVGDDGASAEAPVLRLDSSRARSRLGWAPRWGLDQALDATVAWYAAYRDGADMRHFTLRQIDEYAAAPAGTV